jgi:hypothetical protein
VSRFEDNEDEGLSFDSHWGHGDGHSMTRAEFWAVMRGMSHDMRAILDRVERLEETVGAPRRIVGDLASSWWPRLLWILIGLGIAYALARFGADIPDLPR